MACEITSVSGQWTVGHSYDLLLRGSTCLPHEVQPFTSHREAGQGPKGCQSTLESSNQTEASLPAPILSLGTWDWKTENKSDKGWQAQELKCSGRAPKGCHVVPGTGAQECEKEAWSPHSESCQRNKGRLSGAVVLTVWSPSSRVNFWAHHMLTESETLGWGPALCISSKSSVWCMLKFENHSPREDPGRTWEWSPRTWRS